MSPKVSICIPAYKQVEYFRKALDSILIQDFIDYEIVVSDDTPDDSIEVLLREFSVVQNITYHRNTNPLGSPANWNEAVSLAKGEYIKLLHHDDKFSHPGALRAMVEMLDKNPKANIAIGSSLVSDVVGGRNRNNILKAVDCANITSMPEFLFFGNVFGAPSATIYRNGLGVQYDERMKWLVDIDFYIRILQLNGNFAYTNEILICTPTNAAHQVTELCKDNDLIDLMEHVYLFKKNEHKLKSHPETKKTWYRLFERYKIFKYEDLHFEDAENVYISDTVLPFWMDYKDVYFSRLPNRVYAALPLRAQALIRYLLK